MKSQFQFAELTIYHFINVRKVITKEKGSLFNVKVWMKILVKKSTLCYGNKNRNRKLWE